MLFPQSRATNSPSAPSARPRGGLKRTLPHRLLAELDRRPTLANRALLTELLTGIDGIESPLELRYARDVEARHGLPVGARQMSVSRGTRSDVLYEQDHAALMAEVIRRHANPTAEVVVADPGRGNSARFSRMLDQQGFGLESTRHAMDEADTAPFRGRLLHYSREAVAA